MARFVLLTSLLLSGCSLIHSEWTRSTTETLEEDFILTINSTKNESQSLSTESYTPEGSVAIIKAKSPTEVRDSNASINVESNGTLFDMEKVLEVWNAKSIARVWNHRDDRDVRISENCHTDMVKYFQGVLNGDNWALKSK